MIDRQFKAIAFRGEGKDIEAYVVDCVLAEDCAALIQRAREEAVTDFVDRLMAQPYEDYPMCNQAGDPYARHEIFMAAGLREGEKP